MVPVWNPQSHAPKCTISKNLNGTKYENIPAGFVQRPQRSKNTRREEGKKQRTVRARGESKREKEGEQKARERASTRVFPLSSDQSSSTGPGWAKERERREKAKSEDREKNSRKKERELELRPPAMRYSERARRGQLNLFFSPFVLVDWLGFSLFFFSLPLFGFDSFNPLADCDSIEIRLAEVASPIAERGADRRPLLSRDSGAKWELFGAPGGRMGLDSSRLALF